MNTDRQRLVERVLKLLALAAGTSFEAEADTARVMAEALIAKHNITLPSAKDRTALAEVRYTPHFKGAKWEWMLTDWAAQACGCKAFFFGKEALTEFSLVGTVADLEACQYLLAILHEQRIRDWMRAKREGTPDNFYSFCYSYARGVEQNVRAHLTADEQKRTEQARLWANQRWGNIGTTNLGIHGQGRSEAGHAAGHAASLHRGALGGNADVKRLTHRLPARR
jgi:hypothetical protein